MDNEEVQVIENEKDLANAIIEDAASQPNPDDFPSNESEAVIADTTLPALPPTDSTSITRGKYAASRQREQTVKNALEASTLAIEQEKEQQEEANQEDTNPDSLKNVEQYEARQSLYNGFHYDDPNKTPFENQMADIESKYNRDRDLARAWLNDQPFMYGEKFTDQEKAYMSKWENNKNVYDLKVRSSQGIYTAKVIVDDADTLRIVGTDSKVRILAPFFSGLDASDSPWQILNNKNKAYQKKAIAERLNIAEYEVSDELINAWHDYSTYSLLRALQTGSWSNFERFDPRKVGYYQQYVKDNNNGVEVQLRRVREPGTDRTSDDYGRTFAQVISADGKVNLSDGMALNPYLNLGYNLSKSQMYFYGDAYIKGLLKVPDYVIPQDYELTDVGKQAFNSIYDSFVRTGSDLMGLYEYFTDKEALAKRLQYYQEHPSENFFKLDPGVQLKMQLDMQKRIDQANKGGFYNGLAAFFGAMYDAPLMHLAESAGEMGQLMLGGALGKGLGALMRLGKVGNYITQTVMIAAGAGLQETMNANVDYMVKHQKPMDRGLFLGALTLNSMALGLELPALKNIGAGFRRLAGLPGMLTGKTVLDTSLLAPLRKEFRGFTLAILNEAATEPFQNAVFNAWNDLNGISDIAKYPSAWVKQWQGTNRGQRIFESGSAAGAAFASAAGGTFFSLVASTKHAFTFMHDGTLFDHNADGTALDENDVRLSDEHLKGFREKLRECRAKLAAFDDPANAGNPDFDDAHFQAAWNEYNAIIDTITVDLLANGKTYTASDLNAVLEMQSRAVTHAINLAVRHAQETGQDMQQVCEDLYNLFIAKEQLGTPMPNGVDAVHDILALAATSVFFSKPVAELERERKYIKDQLKNDPDNSRLQEKLAEIEEEIKTRTTYKLKDGTIVDGEQYEEFKAFFERLKAQNLIDPDTNMDDYLGTVFKIDTFGIDEFTHGIYGNSISELKIRIQKAKEDYGEYVNAFKAAITLINDRLPDGHKVDMSFFERFNETPGATREEEQARILGETQKVLDSLSNDPVAADLMKKAIDAYTHAKTARQHLIAEVQQINHFISRRQSKFYGFAKAILDTFQNNSMGVATFTYEAIINGKRVPITLTFNGSTLLKGDITNGVMVIDAQGRISHPDGLILNKIYHENQQLLEVYQQLAEDLFNNDMLSDDDKQMLAINADEQIKANETIWQELVDLQTRIQSGDRQQRNQQIMSAFTTIIEPVLRAAINAAINNPNISKQSQVALIGMMQQIADGSWLFMAQRLSEAAVASNKVPRANGFDFKTLYKSLPEDVREQVKEAIEKALAELIPMTETRTANDSAFEHYSQEKAEEIVKVQPYKDMNANFLYNLQLQIQAVENEEATSESNDTDTQVSDEEVEAAQNDPEAQYKNMEDALIQAGRFEEAQFLRDNKGKIIEDLTQNPLSNDDFLTHALNYSDRFIPSSMRVSINNNGQVQEAVLWDVNLPVDYANVIHKIEDDPNAPTTLKILAYLAKRALPNNDDLNTIRRSGVALGRLMHWFTKEDLSFLANDPRYKVLRAMFSNFVKEYSDKKTITMYTDFGEIDYDFNTPRGLATFDSSTGTFSYNGEQVYIYGQRDGVQYQDCYVDDCYTPRVFAEGLGEITFGTRILLPSSNQTPDTATENIAENQNTDKQNKEPEDQKNPIDETKTPETPEPVVKKREDTYLDDLKDIANYLRGLCAKIFKDGNILYSAGFLKPKQQAFTTEKEIRNDEIQRTVTEIQEYLAVLQNYIDQGGTDQDVIDAVNKMKAGIAKVNDEQIPTPKMDNSIPKRDTIQSYDDLVALSKNYLIRICTGSNTSQLLPIPQPGQNYKVVVVRAVPVEDTTAAVTFSGVADITKSSDDPGALRVGYRQSLQASKLAFNDKHMARGEIIVVPADADGSSIIPNLRVAEDIPWNSRVRQNTHVAALYAPSIFMLDMKADNANSQELSKEQAEDLSTVVKALSFTSKDLIDVSTVASTPKKLQRQQEKKLLGYLRKMSMLCITDDTVATKLMNVIHNVSDFSSVSDPVLRQLLTFLHDFHVAMQKGIDANATNYGMYFLGHNMHKKVFQGELLDVLKRIGNIFEYYSGEEIDRNGKKRSYNLAERVFSATLSEEFSHANFSGQGYRADLSWFITTKLLQDFFIWSNRDHSINKLSTNEWAQELRNCQINPEEVYNEGDEYVYTIVINPKDKKQTGINGEELARSIVENTLGYTDAKTRVKVNNENKKDKQDIDVLAYDKATKTYHLIEVRTRQAGTGYTAAGALDTKKLRNMQKEAQKWATANGISTDNISIDAVLVEASVDHKHLKITYNEDVIPVTEVETEAEIAQKQADLQSLDDNILFSKPVLKNEYAERIKKHSNWTQGQSKVKVLGKNKVLSDEGRKHWKSGCYAGIGTAGNTDRGGDLPSEVSSIMTRCASWLEAHGMVLRSGGATGSDTAFENGVSNKANKEIFYADDIRYDNYGNSAAAVTLASTLHPASQKLSDEALALHSRNGYQVLGNDLKTPVDFILCYTKVEKDVPQGGTAQAIRIAKELNIPVFNLYEPNGLAKFKAFIVPYLNTKGDQEAIHTGTVNTLEVSSKDTTGAGKPLSAMNLSLVVDGKNVSVESVYQASKVWNNSDKSFRKSLLGMSGFQAKKAVKEYAENGGSWSTRCSFNGYTYNNCWQAYATIYFEALKQKLTTIPTFKNILLKAFEYDAYRDTFRGNAVACQADVVTFLKAYYEEHGEQLFEELTKFDSSHMENNAFFKAYTAYFKENMASAISGVKISESKRTELKEDYRKNSLVNPATASLIPSQQMEKVDLSKPDDVDKALGVMFDSIYKNNSTPQVLFPRLLLQSLMYRSNAEAANEVGWSSYIDYVLGQLNTPKTRDSYDRVNNGLYNDCSYILRHSTVDKKDSTAFFNLRAGFSLRTILNAYEGTSDFDTGTLICNDVMALLDKNHNYYFIADSGVDSVSSTGLLRCILAAIHANKAGITDYADELKTVYKMLSLDDAQELRTTLDEATKTKLDNLIAEGVDSNQDTYSEILKTLGLEELHNRAKDTLAQEAKQAANAPVNTNTITTSQRAIKLFKYCQEIEDHLEDASATDLMEALTYISNNINAANANSYVYDKANNLIQKIINAVNDRDVPGFEEYTLRFLTPMQAIFKETEKVDGVINKQVNKEELRERIQIDLTQRKLDKHPVVPHDAEGNYTGVVNPDILIQYESLATLYDLAELTDEEKAEFNNGEFLAPNITDMAKLPVVNGIEDLPKKLDLSGISEDTLNSIEKTVDKALATLTEDLLFDTNIQNDYKKFVSPGSTGNATQIKYLPTKQKARMFLTLMKRNPALSLLYSFFKDQKTGVLRIIPNWTTCIALYTVAIKQLCEFNNFTNCTEDMDFARILNVKEETLKHDVKQYTIKNLLKGRGIPLGMLTYMVGNQVLDALGVRIGNNYENGTKSIREETAQGLGKYALDIIKQINNKQINGLLQTTQQVQELVQLANDVLANDDIADIVKPYFKTTGISHGELQVSTEKTSLTNIAWALISNRSKLQKTLQRVANKAKKDGDKAKVTSIQYLYRALGKFYSQLGDSKPVNQYVETVLPQLELDRYKHSVSDDNTDNGISLINAVQPGTYVNIRGIQDETTDAQKDLKDVLARNFPSMDRVGGLSVSKTIGISKTVAADTKQNVSDVQKDALKILQTTENHIDEEAYQIYNKYQGIIFKLEGGKYEGDSANLTAKERLSDKNKSLSRSFAALHTVHHLLGKAAYYVKYVVSKTMRFQCKGLINPQGDKCHRWLTYAGEEHVCLISTDAVHNADDVTKSNKFEAWALAQAFDMVGKKGEIQKCYNTLMYICDDDARLAQFEVDICTLPEDAIEQKYGLGMENRFQCIAAVAHLKRRNQAVKLGKSSFKTTLRAEIDSTTSGYFIKLMTILDANLIKKFGMKIGINTPMNKILATVLKGRFIEDYDTMEEIKKAINDIYRQIGEEMSKNNKKAIKDTWKNVQELSKALGIEAVFKNKEDYDAFVEAIPAADLVNGDWVVSSDLRQLLKSVVMIFGYSAGENTLEHRLSEAFDEKYETMANDTMRAFVKKLNGKRATLEDVEDFFNNDYQPDPMLTWYFRITAHFLDKFRMEGFLVGATDEVDNTLKRGLVAISGELKHANSEGVEDYNQELNDFIDYYAFYRAQVNGVPDKNGDRIDVIPSNMIATVERIYNQKTGELVKETPFSISEAIAEIFDSSIGRAVLTGMKAFRPISMANHMMATISAILNADAIHQYDALLDKAVYAKSAKIHEGQKPLESLDKNTVEYKRRWLEAYNALTNKEYNDAFADRSFYASMNNIFSMMQQYFSNDNSNPDGTDEYTTNYGLSIADIKYKTQQLERDTEHTASSYITGLADNTYENTAQGTKIGRKIGTTEYVVRKPELIDIGLELTAATTQSYDAGLMTQCIVQLKEMGIEGFFIHDAMVLPFDSIAEGNYCYSIFSTMNSMKYNWMLNYFSKGLQMLDKHYHNIVQKVLSGEELEPGEDVSMYGNTKLLSSLASTNLHHMFGAMSKKEFYKKNKANGTYEEYINGIATVGNFVKLLMSEAEVARINFERFYRENSDTTINNMGGYTLEGADYSIDAVNQDMGEDSFMGAITNAYAYVPLNQSYTIYQKVIEGITKRQAPTTPAPVETTTTTTESTAAPTTPATPSTTTTNTQGTFFSFGENILNSFGTSSGATSTFQEVLDRASSGDSKAIMAVLDLLPKSIKDDPRAIAMFKNFLSGLDLSLLTGWSVQFTIDNSGITQGATNLNTKTIYIKVNNQDTSVMNPSPATVYMHEVMHAILNYAFEERKNNPKMNALIEQMRTIQEEAAKIIKWQDFLDDPQHATQQEINDAKLQWDYVFNNHGQFVNSSEDAGLREFLSYALTDSTFIAKLSSVKIPGKRVTLLTRLKNLMTAMINLLTLRSNLSEMAQQGNWFNNTGLDNYADMNMFEAMQQLAKDIQAANENAAFHHGFVNNTIYSFYNLVDSLRKLGNSYLVPFTRNMFNWSVVQRINYNDPTMTKTKKLAILLATLPFSHNARAAWYDFISNTTRHYHMTDIRLLMDDFSSLDKQREILDTYARNSRAIEAHYQQIRELVMQSLSNGFGRELTQDEYDALTDVIMATDLQCFFNGKNPNVTDIKRLLSDKQFRQKLISKLVNSDLQLSVTLSDVSKKRLQKGIDEISTRWAYVLYYGKGDNFIGTTDDINTIGQRIQYTSIKSVVEHDFGNLPDDEKELLIEEITKVVMQRINKAATAKAVEITATKNPNMVATVANLEDKGLEVFLQEHQTYVQKVSETASALEQEKSRGKGFTMSKYNQTLEYVIAPISDQHMMEYNGFTLVENLHDKKNIYTENGTHLEAKNGQPMGIFVKQTRVLEKRSNSAFTFIATKWGAKDLNSYIAEGLTLDQATSSRIEAYVDSLIASGSLTPEEREGEIARRTKEEMESTAFAILKKYKDNMAFDAFSLTKPHTAAEMEQDILNTAFDGKSYHPMTRQESVEKLKLSRNGFDILSRMVATQTCFNEGDQQNGALVVLLRDFAQNNMNPKNNRDIKTGKKYVDISERLASELHISKAVMCGGYYTEGMPIPPVWVREDFVERLFGVKSVNLSQRKYDHGVRKGYSKYRPMLRAAFEIVEMILKVLSYKEKETIVIRKPAVIIGNVVSNLSYNTLSEPNLKKVIEMNIANVRNTNNYIQAYRRYNELEHQKRIQGKQFPKELDAEMVRLQNRMDNNPIAPLFKSGMFTSIVEDVPLKDREAIQDYFDNFTRNRLVQRIPKSLKAIFNQLYMRPGTPIFDAFYNINKYSDFVARATEYQIQMEKHQKEIKINPSQKDAIEEEVLHDVWNAFIDYDRPNGTVEQYLNDIGLLMFTKYAKGIQRVIVKQMTTNPMGLLIHLAREFALPVAIPDIYEQNVFNKKWSMLIHNPIMNAIDIAIPPLPRLILGLL